MIIQKKKHLLPVAACILLLCGVAFGVHYGPAVMRRLHREPPPEEPMPVLMYHHVVPDGETCNEMTVTPSKLRMDFQWLVDNGYTPVLPRELAAGEALPEKPVMITFDDGYTSNYQLLLPVLREYEMKAVVSIITCMPDIPTTNFMTWDMNREMLESSLVEIGCHTHRLHNLDERNGSFTPGGTNGIQRLAEESDADFRSRVLEDIQTSYDRISEELGIPPTCFAYPFGVAEPDAEELIHSLFPVTLMTRPATADLADGFYDLPRYTITMEKELSSLLR